MSQTVGYSGKSLCEKLGIKPDSKVYVINPVDNYSELLTPLPDIIEIIDTDKVPSAAKFVHLFTNKKNDLQEQFTKIVELLTKDAILWISWPKKSSRLPTDLDENIIREIGLEAGMVDVKVCAVDENWSGLKFVFRLRDRVE